MLLKYLSKYIIGLSWTSLLLLCLNNSQDTELLGKKRKRINAIEAMKYALSIC